MPTEKTPDAIAMNVFPDTILLLHICGFEEYSSRYKIDEIVNNHSNSCK